MIKAFALYKGEIDQVVDSFMTGINSFGQVGSQTALELNETKYTTELEAKSALCDMLEKDYVEIKVLPGMASLGKLPVGKLAEKGAYFGVECFEYEGEKYGVAVAKYSESDTEIETLKASEPDYLLVLDETTERFELKKINGSLSDVFSILQIFNSSKQIKFNITAS